jgi:hypothetical protein
MLDELFKNHLMGKRLTSDKEAELAIEQLLIIANAASPEWDNLLTTFDAIANLLQAAKTKATEEAVAQLIQQKASYKRS